MLVRKIDFYTDGAYSSATKMGGWASICVEDNRLIDSQMGYESDTTNNRMELTAFLSALNTAEHIETRNAQISIHTDSAYIANAINQRWLFNWRSNGWKTADKREVKNQDLWLSILAAYIRISSKFTQFEVIKVKAHSTNKWNNVADLFAVKARMRNPETKETLE